MFHVPSNRSMAANCPSSQPNLLEAETGYDVSVNEVYEEENDEVEYEEEDHNGVEGQSLVTRPLLLTPRGDEEDWRRHSIFMTTCLLGGLKAKLIIDPAASENIVAEIAHGTTPLPIQACLAR